MSDFLFDSLNEELNKLEDVKPSSQGPVELCPGDHNVEVIKAKLWEDDSSASISLLVQSVGGDFDGHSKWVRFAIKTDKDWMRERDCRFLKQIQVANKLKEITSADDLIGTTFGIRLVQKGNYVNLARIFDSVSNPTSAGNVPAPTAAPAAKAADAPSANPFF